MSRPGCAMAAVALSAVAATPAFGGVWFSKTTARGIAVKVTSDTCRTIDWCVGYRVASARRCRRVRDHTIYCPIAFVTADRRRCGGVVAVRKARGGRLDHGMAMPMNCSADRPSPSDIPT
jgi:hypothetical protein